MLVLFQMPSLGSQVGTAQYLPLPAGMTKQEGIRTLEANRGEGNIKEKLNVGNE